MRPGLFTRASVGAIAGLALSCQSPDGPGESQGVALAIVVDVSAAPAIAVVVVTVEAVDLTTPLVFNLAVSEGVASGSILVPAGSDRLVTVTAFDAAGVETHRGTLTITIREGTNPPVTLTILPLEGGLPIEVTIGSLIVLVMPTADTLLIGQTLALDAVVVDQDGDTLPVSVQWATLNPSRAIVDTAGIVTALAAGDVQIVATHGGVGGAAALHVQHSSFSLRFDGSQIATIPDEPALNPSSVMTLEMWVKFDSLDPGQWAVLKDDGTVRQFALGLNGTTSPGPQRRMRAHIRAGGVGGYHTADGATSIPFDTWVHVAQTYDGSVLRLYINGQLDGSTAVNQAMVAEPVDLTFGNNPEGFPLSGNLDEIRLWSVARSQVEIQSTMYTALMGTEPGLVGYWPLEAGSGDVAIDVTANGNQARLGTSVGPDAEDPIWSRDVPRR